MKQKNLENQPFFSGESHHYYYFAELKLFATECVRYNKKTLVQMISPHVFAQHRSQLQTPNATYIFHYGPVRHNKSFDRIRDDADGDSLDGEETEARYFPAGRETEARYFPAGERNILHLSILRKKGRLDWHNAHFSRDIFIPDRSRRASNLAVEPRLFDLHTYIQDEAYLN